MAPSNPRDTHGVGRPKRPLSAVGLSSSGVTGPLLDSKQFDPGIFCSKESIIAGSSTRPKSSIVVFCDDIYTRKRMPACLHSAVGVFQFDGLIDNNLSCPRRGYREPTDTYRRVGMT